MTICMPKLDRVAWEQFKYLSLPKIVECVDTTLDMEIDSDNKKDISVKGKNFYLNISDGLYQSV